MVGAPPEGWTSGHLCSPYSFAANYNNFVNLSKFVNSKSAPSLSFDFLVCEDGSGPGLFLTEKTQEWAWVALRRMRQEAFAVLQRFWAQAGALKRRKRSRPLNTGLLPVPVGSTPSCSAASLFGNSYLTSEPQPKCLFRGDPEFVALSTLPGTLQAISAWTDGPFPRHQLHLSLCRTPAHCHTLLQGWK